MRKAFFHPIQPVAHDELFDFAMKMAREANLDARAISEEDTLVFFKRIVAKLHGVNLNKEFVNPKKKQENTVKAITSGERTSTKGGGKSKGKAPALSKGLKGKGKGKKGDRSQTPPTPTKWMTNCSLLATLLGVRCTGGHDPRGPYRHQSIRRHWRKEF